MADQATFLSNIQSANADTRFAAWRASGEQGPGVIRELAKIAGGDDPGVRKAALEAMTTLTHSVGKDGRDARRSAVTAALLAVAGESAYATPVRAHALRLVSLSGGDDAIPTLVTLLKSADLREEAVYALERIPGGAANGALASACAAASEDFRPRLLAALGHRRAPEGVPLAVAAMRSPGKELSLAGMKAYGRIGRKPAAVPRYPSVTGLSGSQISDHWDSRLRWADAQVAAGNHADAMAEYKRALEAPEEHLQCAAIVGIAKMDTAEAAATLFPKLRSSNRTVRITAEQAWKRMASTVSPKG